MNTKCFLCAFVTWAFVAKEHIGRSEEHTSELQSRLHLVCRLLLEKKKKVYTRSSAQHFALLSSPQYTTATCSLQTCITPPSTHMYSLFALAHCHVYYVRERALNV